MERIPLAFVTSKLPKLLFRLASLNNPHGPRLSEYGRVGDRHFIVHRDVINKDESLQEVCLVAKKISDDIKPRFRIEIGCVHDQRVALPTPSPIPRP